MKRIQVFFLSLLFLCASGVICRSVAAAQTPVIELQNNEQAGLLHVLFDGQKIFTYRYTSWLDLPHIFPMKSPSGKNMLIQQTEPYPHHRSFYFGDTVRLEGSRQVSIYNALYTGQKIGTNAYGPPFRDHIRHLEFLQLQSEGNRAVIETKSIWEMDGNTPVLDEKRLFVITAFEKGEYFIDISYTLTASYGDVEFVSDDVHYAWPFIRLDPVFSGSNGGTIESSSGARGEKATNMNVALWIDYSNTVDGLTEGVAVYQKPDGQDHRWLTREYGIFGPRRPDNRSGKPFQLSKGDSITQQAGVLVHRGNAETGRVAERYQKYISGGWNP